MKDSERKRRQKQSISDRSSVFNPYKQVRRGCTNMKRIQTGHRATGDYQNPTASLHQMTYQFQTEQEMALEREATRIIKAGKRLGDVPNQTLIQL